MDFDRSYRFKTSAYRRSETGGSTRSTSPDDTTPARDVARERLHHKRKTASLRSESTTYDQRRQSIVRPFAAPSDSSPDLTRGPVSTSYDVRSKTTTTTTGGSQRRSSHRAADDGLRTIVNFNNDDPPRNMRPSQESTRTPKSSLESDRRSVRISEDKMRAQKKANRKSITVIPENKGDWDASTAMPASPRHSRRGTKSRPTTSSREEDDLVLNTKALRMSRSRDDLQSDEGNDSRPSPIVDPRKMLQLMRTTRGRMQGPLNFRHASNYPWTDSNCFVDVDSGSLCCQDGDGEQIFCLIKDLRKCEVQAVYHSDSREVALHITAINGYEIFQIRPQSSSFTNAWFAALLCWSSVQLGQRLTDRREQQRPNLIRQVSNFLPIVDGGTQANPIRKVGSAVLVEIEEAKMDGTPQDQTRLSKTKWTNVSCLLNAKGEFRLLSKDLSFIASVQLAELPRSAIQRLGPSVLGADCVIAVYPQYAQSTSACSRLRPIYLSFESRELYEVWFVLLRAHAIPELYGTSRMQATGSPMDIGVLPGLEPPATPMYFRLERSLHLKLNEARVNLPTHQPSNGFSVSDRIPDRHQRKQVAPANYCVEVLLDGQVKAKSTIKHFTTEPVWYEQFDFYDFATSLSTVTIRLKRQEIPPPPDDVQVMSSAPIPGVVPPELQPQYRQRGPDAPVTLPFMTIGEASVETSMLSTGVDVDSWHSLTDEIGNTIGEVSVKFRQEEDTVLMDREYDAISDLIHNFSNALTLQIYERIPLELGRLSVCLLNIFQVSGSAADWLMALAEEEVDGVREQALGRHRFTQRLDSRDSHESLVIPSAPGNREDIVRELNKSATQEANLLFRGNSLLSKALDFHMRRIGRTYLDETIGGPLRQIAVDDIDCEVDPARLLQGHDIQKSWKRLMNLTESIWDRIRKSAKRCPSELRTIFRHIRACADDRYGDYMRTVTYSSVSGFLFLRFFCAAVLNPHLFALINISPSGRAQRAYILIAKSLNGLASMTTFGNKEPWMTPMNAFLSRNRQTFKNFVDEVCSIRADEPSDPLPTSYAAPIMLFQKLPVLSREGFPSLPHLVDRARNLAALVDIWLEGLKDPQNEPMGHASGAKLSNTLTGDLARFHDACLSLRQRTRAAWHAADRSERVPSGLAHKWVAIAERMEVAPEEYWAVNKTSALGPTSAKPSPQSINRRSSTVTPEKQQKRLSVKSPSRRKSKQTPESLTNLAPPVRPMSTAPQRSPSTPRPRTASQPVARPVATASQLAGNLKTNDLGLAYSSNPSTEDSDEDGRAFVMRTMRDLSGEHLPGIGRPSAPTRRVGNPYLDPTLTPETLHGRALKIGSDKKEEESSDREGPRFEAVEKNKKEGKEGRRSFWKRKSSKREDDDEPRTWTR